MAEITDEILRAIVERLEAGAAPRRTTGMTDDEYEALREERALEQQDLKIVDGQIQEITKKEKERLRIERELRDVREGSNKEYVKLLMEQKKLLGESGESAKLMGSFFGNISREIMGSSQGIETFVKSVGKSILGAGKLLKVFKGLSKTIGAIKIALLGVKALVGAIFSFGAGALVMVIASFIGYIKDLILGAEAFKKEAAGIIGTTKNLEKTFKNLRSTADAAKMGFLGVEKAFMNIRNVLPIIGAGATELAASLAQDVAILEKLGFAADNQGRNLNIFMTLFSKTAKEAQKENFRLMNMAQVFNMTGDEISRSFQEATQTLGQFGNFVMKSFPRLQAFAKKTGTAFGSLVGIINKFNTFEDAADAVGKLNAIMGGPFLDSVELLQKENPADIIESIVGAFDDAGMDLQKSGRHMRYAVSQILGVSADEAARLLKGGADAFQDATITAEQAAKLTSDKVLALVQDAMKTRTRMDTLIDEVKSVMASLDRTFGVSGFVTQALNGLIQGIQSLPFFGTGNKYTDEKTGRVYENLSTAQMNALRGAESEEMRQKILSSLSYTMLSAPLKVRVPELEQAPNLARADLRMGALANGGPANLGQPYIVGERGRELFIPNQSGMVQSNETYLTKEDFNRGVAAIVDAMNINITMDGRVVSRIVTKEQNKLFVGGYDRG